MGYIGNLKSTEGANIPIVPVGGISSTTLQSFVSEVDSEKINTTTYASNDGLVGGTIKMRVSGATLYITNNGDNA